MKSRSLFKLCLLFICAVFFACAGFAVSDYFKREDIITARATTATTTIYWGVSGTTLNISSTSISGSPNGSFSGTSNSPNWSSYKNNITEVNFLTDVAPSSTANWFSGFNRLIVINNINKLNTDNVSQMYNMFNGCTNLAALDVSKFNTYNVTNMGSMFFNCKSLTTLDVSDFIFSNCTSAINLVNGCENLTELNLANADFSQALITDMLAYLKNLKKLNISETLADKIADANLFSSGSPTSWYGIDGIEYNVDNLMTQAGTYTTEKPECQHDWLLQGDKASECIGGTEIYYCVKCGETKTETIEALGHTKGTHHDAVAATCSKTGNVEYWECANGCGKFIDDSLTELSTVTIPINPNAHSFTNYVSNNNATCTDNATETADCSNGCGQTDTREILGTAKGHKWATAWSKDATNHWHVCENGCGVKGGETAHVYNWVTDTPATLTTSGIKHEECLCGAKRNENTEIPIQTCAHANLTHYDRIEATCAATGNIEYWHCADCNKNLDSVNTELPDITIPIDNTAHVYTNYVPDNNATCTADGTKTAQCDHGCGATDTVTDAGSMTQHSYEWVITKPATKDEAGLMQNKCSVCGDVAEEKEIAKLEDPNGGGEIDLPVDINVEFKVTQSSTDNDYSELEGLKRGYWAQLWYRNEDGTLGDEFTDKMNCFLTLKIPTEIIEAIRGGEEINRDKIAEGLTVYYYVDGQRYDVDNFAIAQRDDESWQIKFNYNAKFRAEVVFNAANFSENSEPAAGIPWWVWLLVGLGGAAVVGVVIVIIVVAKKKSAAAVVADNGEVLGRLDKQDEKLNEIREIVDGGFNDIVDDE